MVSSTITPSFNPNDYRIFPLDHNWNSSLTSSFEFLTDIIMSGNGKEQRRAVRFEPRRRLEMTCNYKGEEKIQLDRFMVRGLNQPCWVAEEQFVCYTAGYLFAEDFGVDIYGPRRYWMQPGRKVILSNGWRKETRTLAGATDGRLTFSDKSLNEFPANTKICPATLAYIEPTPRTTRLTSTVGTVKITAEVIPGGTWNLVNNNDTYYVGSREFFNYRNNWGSSPELQYTYERETVDFNFGMIEIFSPYNYSARIHKTVYTTKTADQAQNYIDFFCRHRGRNREFLMQSFEPDVPYFAVAAGSRSLLIEGTGFAYDYQGTTTHRRIIIRPRNGEPIHAQVDYIEALPDTNTTAVWLTQDLPAGVNLAPAQVYGAGWVFVSRFATDRLDVEWLTSEVASIPITVQTLENFDV